MIAVPARTGLRAVAQIFAPHLFLPLLLLVPFAFRRGGFGLGLFRALLVGCALIFCLRYLPAFASTSPAYDPASPRLSVLTWNVFAGNRRDDSVRDLLLEKPVDVVVLQESNWGALSSDEALMTAYPYTLGGNTDAPPGMTLLSIYPVVESGILDGDRSLWDIPRLLWARLDVDGTEVTVITAHPISPYYSGRNCSLPICFEPTLRDRQITAMHNFLQPLVERGEPFVLAGDFNVTEREPAYADLSSGLTDTFKAVGSGLGTTWRPPFVMSQPVGLLRIDYLFAGPRTTPMRITTDCTPRSSDHCVLIGQFQISR
jgi:endonuclease/exonuclease/phosphatase (EEP) superfamily protein YafD